MLLWQNTPIKRQGFGKEIELKRITKTANVQRPNFPLKIKLT